MSEKNITHFTDSIYYSLEQIGRYLEINSKEFFSKITTKITPEEFRTIDVILCNPDICQRDLAKLILRDRVRTGRILDSLEEKGLIERYSDIKNKRLVKKMRLTKKGHQCFAEVTERTQPYIKILSEKFTDAQRQELKNLLGLLKNALSENVKLEV